jgi:hypothetical protein
LAGRRWYDSGFAGALDTEIQSQHSGEWLMVNG